FEGDELTCERVYFDANTVLRQLGIARDPLSITGRLGTAINHPLTIGRGLVRQVIGRARARRGLGGDRGPSRLRREERGRGACAAGPPRRRPGGGTGRPRP